MKVLLFSRYPKNAEKPKGGIESVTVILSQGLSLLKDIDLHVVTFDPEIEKDEMEKTDGITIHRLVPSGWPQILDILFGPGRRKLVKKINQIKPDIVHAHESLGLNLSSLKIPFIFTVHGFDHANIPAEGRPYPKIRGMLWEFVEKYCLGKLKHIISISPYVTKMIEPHSGANIHEIDNPVDGKFYDLNRKNEPGRILCVGWINERKNTLGAVKAFSEVIRSGINGKLVIAGMSKKPKYMEKIIKEMDKNGNASKVEILGHIDRHKLMEELTKANLLLLPSYQENAPMAIAEAMAAGVPVIASNRCGMPFMVEEGESGYLVEPDNVEQIADRIRRIVSSEQLTGRMGKKGKEIALRRFHYKVVAEATIKVYEEIISVKFNQEI
jgi:glycosyltransferase involved in cell wall biosynthesis